MDNATAEEKQEWDRLPGVHVADPSPTDIGERLISPGNEGVSTSPEAKAPEASGVFRSPPSADEAALAARKPDVLGSHGPITGTLFEKGEAPYQFGLHGSPSYFVRVKAPDETYVFWGVDLQRAVESSGVKLGNSVTVASVGKDRNRNVWKVEPAGLERPQTEAPNRIEHVNSTDQADPPKIEQQRKQATQSRAQTAAAKDEDRTLETIARMAAPELDAYVKAQSSGNRDQADRVLKTAEQRISSEVDRPTSFRPALEDRFNVVSRIGRGRDYYYRDKPGRMAFSERWVSMTASDDSPAAVSGMLDRLEQRGWKAFKITKGSLEFKRQAWIGAAARGIAASGYEPTQGDRTIADEERGRLSRQRAADGVGDGGTVVKETVREQSIERPATPDQQRANVISVLDASFAAKSVPAAMQEKVRRAVNEELDRRYARGEKPAVAVYDHEAPAQKPTAVKAPSHKRQPQHEWTR